MLKYLGCMFLVTIVYLLSGTTSSIQYWWEKAQINSSINKTNVVNNETINHGCPIFWWHLVNFGGIFLFLYSFFSCFSYFIFSLFFINFPKFDSSIT
jgi:hypothetical protein